MSKERTTVLISARVAETQQMLLLNIHLSENS